jgi:hypothetical protein
MSSSVDNCLRLRFIRSSTLGFLNRSCSCSSPNRSCAKCSNDITLVSWAGLVRRSSRVRDVEGGDSIKPKGNGRVWNLACFFHLVHHRRPWIYALCGKNLSHRSMMRARSWDLVGSPSLVASRCEDGTMSCCRSSLWRSMQVKPR